MARIVTSLSIYLIVVFVTFAIAAPPKRNDANNTSSQVKDGKKFTGVVFKQVKENVTIPERALEELFHLIRNSNPRLNLPALIKQLPKTVIGLEVAYEQYRNGLERILKGRPEWEKIEKILNKQVNSAMTEISRLMTQFSKSPAPDEILSILETTVEKLTRLASDGMHQMRSTVQHVYDDVHWAIIGVTIPLIFRSEAAVRPLLSLLRPLFLDTKG